MKATYETTPWWEFSGDLSQLLHFTILIFRFFLEFLSLNEANS